MARVVREAMVSGRRPVALAALTLLGCRGQGEDEAEPEPTVEVATAVVERISMPELYQLTGHLRPVPGGSALLTAPADGIVQNIRGQTGTVVTAGDTVVALDTPELAAAARQLAAEADLAAREAARTDTLFRDGIVARKDVERAAAALVSARAAATAAAQLASRSLVVAPLSGEIQRVLVQRGERVEAGQLLAEVIDPTALHFAATAPAEILARLRKGQPARVTIGRDSLDVVVEAVAPAVDSLTGVGEALIRIPNRSHGFRPGQAASAVVTAGTAHDVLAVPEAAIVLVGSTPTVFVVTADSVAHAHPVTPGLRAAGLVEVRGDVAVGDRVVTVGAYGLADGSRVILTQPTAE